MHSLPFPRSYWVEPARLLAGCYPGDLAPTAREQKLEGLIESGVRRVVSLMEGDENDHAGDPFIDYAPELTRRAALREIAIACVRHPIIDQSIPSVGAMRAILDEIDAGLGSGHAVYVHCWGGRGRTGTVIGCWLIRHRQATPETALAALQALTAHDPRAFRPTPETVEQRAFVRAWKEAA